MSWLERNPRESANARASSPRSANARLRAQASSLRSANARVSAQVSAPRSAFYGALFRRPIAQLQRAKIGPNMSGACSRDAINVAEEKEGGRQETRFP